MIRGTILALGALGVLFSMAAGAILVGWYAWQMVFG